jgi:hypothetical protein
MRLRQGLINEVKSSCIIFWGYSWGYSWGYKSYKKKHYVNRVKTYK